MDALLFRREPEVLGEIGVLLLDEAQVRDVLGCADDRHDDAVGVHHRLVPHPDPHRCPVPAEHREVALPGAAGVHIGEDRGGTVLLGGGHQHVSDGLAQHLVSGPPVQLLGLLVPQEDASVGVGDDDRPREGVDHRPKVQRRILLHRQVAHLGLPLDLVLR